MKKVVTIGGGSGSACPVRALKKYTDAISLTAIVSMCDSGGSSGKLRKEFNTVAVGDIMRAIVAMSKYDYDILKPIFYETRFSNLGKFDGHNLGNLFLILASEYGHDMLASVAALEQAVHALGNVYPATIEPANLCARLTNGAVLIGEHAIDKPDCDREYKIADVWLDPEPALYEKAGRSVEQADYVILSTGSLYCSIIPSLLVRGMREAMDRSKAKIIYVAGNAYEKEGETGPAALSEFVAVANKYLPRRLDTVIFDSQEISGPRKKMYEEKKWELIQFDPQNISQETCVIAEPFEKQAGGINSKALGELLMKLIFEK